LKNPVALLCLLCFPLLCFALLCFALLCLTRLPSWFDANPLKVTYLLVTFRSDLLFFFPHIISRYIGTPIATKLTRQFELLPFAVLPYSHHLSNTPVSLHIDRQEIQLVPKPMRLWLHGMRPLPNRLPRRYSRNPFHSLVVAIPIVSFVPCNKAIHNLDTLDTLTLTTVLPCLPFFPSQNCPWRRFLASHALALQSTSGHLNLPTGTLTSHNLLLALTLVQLCRFGPHTLALSSSSRSFLSFDILCESHTLLGLSFGKLHLARFSHIIDRAGTVSPPVLLYL